MHACMLNRFSRVRFCATPWTAATQQSPLTTGFSRQEYWSGLPPLSPEFLGSIKNLTRQTSHFRPVSCISVYGNATLPVVETCFPTAHQEILLFLPSQRFHSLTTSHQPGCSHPTPRHHHLLPECLQYALPTHISFSDYCNHRGPAKVKVRSSRCSAQSLAAWHDLPDLNLRYSFPSHFPPAMLSSLLLLTRVQQLLLQSLCLCFFLCLKHPISIGLLPLTSFRSHFERYQGGLSYSR